MESELAITGHVTVGRTARWKWIVSVLVAALIPVSSALAFGFEDVVARARQLAAGPYQPPPETPSLCGRLGTTNIAVFAIRRSTISGAIRLPISGVAGDAWQRVLAHSGDQRSHRT